jgi:hypothetical protein
MGYNSSSLHSIKSIDGSAIVIHFVFWTRHVGICI